MKNLRKKIRKIRKDYGMHLGYPRPNDLFMGYPDAYEEARQNKAYYDLCRQNVIDGERAELLSKSLFWLKVASILLCISLSWSLACGLIKVGDVFLVASIIWFGLAVVSTGVHLWYERKIKKLVNVK